LRVPFTYEPPHKVWNGRTPERGEVVVFMHPNDPGRDMVKRVLAVEGDTIRFRDGQVSLRKRGEPQFVLIERTPKGRAKVCDYEGESDAWRLQESDAFEERLGGATYLALGRSDPPDLPGHESFRQALADTRRRAPGAAVDAIRDTFGPIPEGHVFMVGDNREYSEDSRYWGTVPYEYLKGPALFNIYSYGAQPEESCANEGFFSRIRWGRFFRSVD
jgi:signal peptidase I